MSMYKELKARKQEIDHHCSDLYTPVNEVTKKLIENYEFKENVRTFINANDKKEWFDIPFAYNPYWENKEKELNNETKNYRVSQFNKLHFPIEQEEIPLIKIKIYVGNISTNYLNITQLELDEIQRLLTNKEEN